MVRFEGVRLRLLTTQRARNGTGFWWVAHTAVAAGERYLRVG